MYTPTQPGIPAIFKRQVRYVEVFPDKSASDVVYCFWELRTKGRLDRNFSYLVLPDACVDTVFDVGAKPVVDGALLMTPGYTATKIGLGKQFHFVGIRLRPGAFGYKLPEIVGQNLLETHLAGQDMAAIRRLLAAAKTLEQRVAMLEQVVSAYRAERIIADHPFVKRVLLVCDDAPTVAELARRCACSPRQLQRQILKHFGYSPKTFLKILRFQAAIRQNQPDGYADQSHFIRDCRRVAGLTPGIMSEIFNTKGLPGAIVDSERRKS